MYTEEQDRHAGCCCLCELFKLQIDYSDDHLPILGSREEADLSRWNQSTICSASDKSTGTVMRKPCSRKCLAVWLNRTVCCLSSRSGPVNHTLAPELPTKVCRALEICLTPHTSTAEGRSWCPQIRSSHPAGGPRETRLKGLCLAKSTEYGFSIRCG